MPQDERFEGQTIESRVASGPGVAVRPSAGGRRTAAVAALLAAGLAVCAAYLLLMPISAPLAQDPAPETHDVDAVGAVWQPSSLQIAVGDSVRWNFPADTAVFPHDVWLVPPGGDPAPGGDLFEVTSGIVFPGGASVSHTFNQEGAWVFVCRVHSGFSGGEWVGQVGTVQVGAGEEPDFEPYGRSRSSISASRVRTRIWARCSTSAPT